MLPSTFRIAKVQLFFIIGKHNQVQLSSLSEKYTFDKENVCINYNIVHNMCKNDFSLTQCLCLLVLTIAKGV